MNDRPEPMMKLQPGGVAPVISYNVPEPTTYSGRNFIDLQFPASYFVVGTHPAAAVEPSTAHLKALASSDPGLDAFGGTVADSGEGRWTVQAANEAGVPAHVLTAALFERFASRGQDRFQNQVLSAMRKGFGGHVEKR